VILTNARELRKLARAARYALLGPNKKRKIKNRTNSQRKGCLYIFRLSERKYRSPSGTTVQIRTRTNSHELDGNSKKPKHARAKAVKRSGKIKKNKTRIRKIKQKSRKPKESPWDPGRHFPVVPHYSIGTLGQRGPLPQYSWVVSRSDFSSGCL
jgi:hypothetical protein